MKLYIVDLWVPFPSSEYGGVIIVIANNNEEAVDILSNYGEVKNQFHPKHMEKNLIVEAVNDAISYDLSGEHRVGVIKSFIT